MVKHWHEKTDLEWMKVYDRWFTSPSHVALDAVSLLVGLRCMSIANRRGRQPDGSGYVLDGAGRPLGEREIARESHAEFRDTKTALRELLLCGTLTRREDGAYGFLNLKKWQEDPSTERQRRKSEKREIHGEIHDQTIRRSDDQRSLDRTSSEKTSRATSSPDAADVDIKTIFEKVRVRWGDRKLVPIPFFDDKEVSAFYANFVLPRQNKGLTEEQIEADAFLLVDRVAESSRAKEKSFHSIVSKPAELALVMSGDRKDWSRQPATSPPPKTGGRTVPQRSGPYEAPK